MQKTYDIWNTANRLVEETLENVDKSIFQGVYQNADRMLYDFVKGGEKSDNSDRKRDEQVANVLSFLGKRGRGKTSSMVSFFSWLNKLQISKWSEFEKNRELSVRFYTIPCIDAAMLAKDEFLIDVILAKMWDKFEDFNKKPFDLPEDANLTYLTKQIKEEFVEVRKAYLILKKKEKEAIKDEEQDVFVASGLHDLAASMNLKEKLQALIDNYIKVLGHESESVKSEGYLVLAIDDVDMAGKKAWEILEQIRRFLSLHKVIIFMTADINRLNHVCEAFCKDVYMNDDASLFVRDYLEKILPINKRVYMPELSDNQKDIPIQKHEGIFGQLQLKNEYEKELILELIAKNCHIYLNGRRRKRHFLQNESLRSLANYFHQLKSVGQEEYIIWLKKDLQERLIERVENGKDKEFLIDLLSEDYEDINNLVINYVKNKVEERNSYLYDVTLELSDESMGEVLYACSILEDQNVKNAGFVNCILVLYAIMLYQADSELQKKIIGNSVWGEWEYRALTTSTQITDDIRGFQNRAALVFEVTRDVEEAINGGMPKIALALLLTSNMVDIHAWICSLLFVNFTIPAYRKFAFEIIGEGSLFEKPTEDTEIPKNSQEPKTPEDSKAQDSKTQDSKTQNSQQSYFVLQPCVTARKGFFGFLYQNTEDYRKRLQQLLTDGIMAFYEYLYKEAEKSGCGIQEEKMAAEDLAGWVLECMQIFKWEEKEGEPQKELLQSTEILYSIGRALGNEQMNSADDTENLFETMGAMLQIIKDELVETDRYYQNEIQLETRFEQYFKEKIQVKLFLEPSFLKEDGFTEAFEKCFTQLFGVAIQVNSPKKTGRK